MISKTDLLAKIRIIEDLNATVSQECSAFLNKISGEEQLTATGNSIEPSVLRTIAGIFKKIGQDHTSNTVRIMEINRIIGETNENVY